MEDCYYPKFIGSAGCQHGSYTFYKAFKYYKNEKCKILMLGEFFFVKISTNEDPCIGELQLLWQDKNTDQMLSSVRLYFLPEQTPLGRQSHHGEHEVIAAAEKVILRLDDLVSWITDEVDWNHGLRGVYEGSVKSSVPVSLSSFHPGTNGSVIKEGIDLTKVFMDSNSGLDFDDVIREKELIGYQQDPDALGIFILTYPRYLRYSAMLQRLNGEVNNWINHTLIVALGGFTVSSRNVHILFCRDYFDHEGLAQNDANCDHLAPIFKGRPRKKKPKALANSDFQYNENYGQKVKKIPKRPLGHAEEGFLRNLFDFMRDRNTPIHRVPNLGFKQIDLYLFFSLVQKLGGYEQITHKKQWKLVYDELGGNPGSTSAATCTRRHYERLLLPYERHLNGEDDKPLPPPPPPRIRNKKLSHEKEKNGMTQDELSCMFTDSEASQNRIISSDKFYDGSSNKDQDTDSHDEYMEDEWVENIKEELNNYLIENHNPALGINRNNGCEDKERKWKEIRDKNVLARNWARQLRPLKISRKSNTLERYQQILKDAMQQHHEPHGTVHCESSKIESTSQLNENEVILRGVQPVMPVNCISKSSFSNDLYSKTHSSNTNSPSHNYYLPSEEYKHSLERTHEPSKICACASGNTTSVVVSCSNSNSPIKVHPSSLFSDVIIKSEAPCSISSYEEYYHMRQPVISSKRDVSSNKCDLVNDKAMKTRSNFSIMSPLMHRKSNGTPSGQITIGYATDNASHASHIPHDKLCATDLGYNNKDGKYCQLRPSVIRHTEPIKPIDKKIIPIQINNSHNSHVVFSSSVTNYAGSKQGAEEPSKIVTPLCKNVENVSTKLSNTLSNKMMLYEKVSVADINKIPELTKLKSSLTTELEILRNCPTKELQHSRGFEIVKHEDDELRSDREIRIALASQKQKTSTCNTAQLVSELEIKLPSSIRIEPFSNSVITKNNKYRFDTDEPYFDKPKRIQLSNPPDLSSSVKCPLSQSHLNYKTTSTSNKLSSFTSIDDCNTSLVLDLSVKKKSQSTVVETIVPSPTPPKTPADGVCLDLSLKKKVINTTSPSSGIENITPPPEEIEPPLYQSSPFVVSVMKTAPHLTIPVISGNVNNSKVFNGASQKAKSSSNILSNRILTSDNTSSTIIEIPSTPSPSPLSNHIKSTSKSGTMCNYNFSSQSLDYMPLRSSFWSSQPAHFIPSEDIRSNLDNYKEFVDQDVLQYQYHIGPHLYSVVLKDGQGYPE